MTVLGVGYLAREVRDLLTRRVAFVVVAAWLVVATVGEYHFSRDPQQEWLPIQRAEVEAVFDILPPDATIVSIEAPQPLVLTSRTNPLPHQMFSEGLDGYVDDTWPGGLTGFADDIDRLKPTVIARGTTRPTWLEQVLARDYWRSAPPPAGPGTSAAPSTPTSATQCWTRSTPPHRLVEEIAQQALPIAGRACRDPPFRWSSSERQRAYRDPVREGRAARYVGRACRDPHGGCRVKDLSVTWSPAAVVQAAIAAAFKVAVA